MTITENNVAAQAGDELRCPFCDGEPRHLRKLEGIYVEALICDACNFGLAPEKWRQRAAQVSPRATADVERESANALLEELLILEAQENIARSDGNGEGITTKRLDSLTARVAQYLATTKPGA